MDAWPSFLLPEQQDLLGRLEGWLPALYREMRVAGGGNTSKWPAREHRVLEEGKRTHQLAGVRSSRKEVLYPSLASAMLRKA